MEEARLERVRVAIRDEVSAILREFKDPRLGFVSVTDVAVAKDARMAKVFVSVLGGEEVKESSLAALKSGAGFVRSELGRRLVLRHTPEIIFRLDDSIERGVRVQSLLGQLYPEGPPGLEDTSRSGREPGVTDRRDRDSDSPSPGPGSCPSKPPGQPGEG